MCFSKGTQGEGYAKGCGRPQGQEVKAALQDEGASSASHDVVQGGRQTAQWGTLPYKEQQVTSSSLIVCWHSANCLDGTTLTLMCFLLLQLRLPLN